MIRCNHLERRVFIQRCAVCDEDGEVFFHASGSSFTGILDKAPENHRGNAAETVPAVTLDTFVFEQGNPAPDIIKIDVESAEALVLAGASRLLQTKRPRLIIEVHGPNACSATIGELLRNNYQVRLVTAHARPEVSQSDQLRDIFVRNRWTHHLLACPQH
jgi:FkbM family methyltransferase